MDNNNDEEYIPPDYKPAERICMTCSNKFNSEGIHNRVCDSCKKLSKWKNANLHVSAGFHKQIRVTEK